MAAIVNGVALRAPKAFARGTGHVIWSMLSAGSPGSLRHNGIPYKSMNVVTL